jgi:hypothetical protein
MPYEGERCSTCYYYHKGKCCQGKPRVGKYKKAYWPTVEEDEWCWKYLKQEQKTEEPEVHGDGYGDR